MMWAGVGVGTRRIISSEDRATYERARRAMANTSDYLALDLGAESGRGLLGKFDGERLILDELHRFPNGPVKMLDTLYWDTPRLFDEMKTALRKALATGSTLEGLGIDTWGVDFGLVGRGDTLLGN